MPARVEACAVVFCEASAVGLGARNRRRSRLMENDINALLWKTSTDAVEALILPRQDSAEPSKYNL
jgi:hypothetical protein